MQGVLVIFRRLRVLGLAIVIAVGVVGATPGAAEELAQAAKPAAAEEDVANDPLEPLNRFFFEFNEVFQTMLLRPVTEIYEFFVAPPIREAIGNVVYNLRTPIILANDILQAEPERAWQTTQRLVVNTTWGLGGLFDRASEMGIPKHEEDFGQTLGVWGVGEWFYLVLPFFGPSSPRDAVGKYLVDDFLDPFGRWVDNTDRDALAHGRMGLYAVTVYSGVMDELAQVKKTSIDFYAAIRSMYRQKRRAEILNGRDRELPPIPDIIYELK